ncbi:MAG: peptidylprolyl isomerase [Deltaproteobacteria bacterium]|nr:MAG: peptidylprolyl isomerase [Deltaproteobacteria bacterium]
MGFFDRRETQKPPFVATFDENAKVQADLHTSLGKVSVRLFAQQCPLTVGNFVALARGESSWTDPAGNTVKKPLYDGTIFHRVIPDFMIQGGDPAGTGSGGPGYRFGDEIVAELSHSKPGILSMANAGPNTNGSQFFLTEAATPWLDGKHTVFGEVIAGMDIVSKIARVPCGAQDRPKEEVRLERVTITVS